MTLVVLITAVTFISSPVISLAALLTCEGLAHSKASACFSCAFFSASTNDLFSASHFKRSDLSRSFTLSLYIFFRLTASFRFLQFLFQYLLHPQFPDLAVQLLELGFPVLICHLCNIYRRPE